MLLPRLCVEKHHAVVRPVVLVESVRESVPEIAPLEIGPDVCEINEALHRERDPQPPPLPSKPADAGPRYLEGAQVVAAVVVKLDLRNLLYTVWALLRAHPRHSQHRPVAVPEHGHPVEPRLVLGGAEARVDEDGLLVVLRHHHLHPPVVEADRKRGCLGVDEPLHHVVPHETGDPRGGVVAEEGDLVDVVSHLVVNVHLPLRRTKQNLLSSGRPFDKLQLHLQLLAPQPVSIDATDNDSTILVDNADLHAVSSPFHVLDHRLVAVVDHLLKPHALVQHPHDDQPVLIARGELLVHLVPRCAHNRFLMPLQGLIHRQVARPRDPPFLPLSGALELEHLEQPRLASASDPSLVSVPLAAPQFDAVGDGDLLVQVDEHRGLTAGLTWSL
mmetsp:Transcript_32780/g.76568  ORF Transcript_32780/g.76568 Transcript_32780/m.76568 type:complete len:387 (-) Transcript_32780:74-1234(-)